MEIKIGKITAFLEKTSTGVIKLSIPSTGLFIIEKSCSLSETDLKLTEDKIIKRAQSLLWNFPVKTKYDL